MKGFDGVSGLSFLSCSLRLGRLRKQMVDGDAEEMIFFRTILIPPISLQLFRIYVWRFTLV
jgi:hypothetical protein